MSLKEHEDKAMDPPIPEPYTKEYTKFCQVVAAEDDCETLDAAQVKFRHLLMRMSTLKVPIPPGWSDAHNACGEKSARLRAAAFQRRMG